MFGEEMKHCIVYWSRFGNGKKVVDYIGNKLKEKKHEVQVFKTDDIHFMARYPDMLSLHLCTFCTNVITIFLLRVFKYPVVVLEPTLRLR